MNERHCEQKIKNNKVGPILLTSKFSKMIEYAYVNSDPIIFTIALSLFVASPFLIGSIISKEHSHPLRSCAEIRWI